jgi:hypothetical protein
VFGRGLKKGVDIDLFGRLGYVGRRDLGKGAEWKRLGVWCVWGGIKKKRVVIGGVGVTEEVWM